MFVIRRANLGDAKGIHEAHMRSIREVCSKEHTEEEISGWGNRPFNEGQRILAIENHLVWVVEINDIIEGYAQIAFREKNGVLAAHIFGLYLTANALGFGLGKKLLQLMLNEAKGKKVNQITLESTITARGFYQKFGFMNSAEQLIVQIGGSGVR